MPSVHFSPEQHQQLLEWPDKQPISSQILIDMIPPLHRPAFENNSNKLMSFLQDRTWNKYTKLSVQTKPLQQGAAVFRSIASYLFPIEQSYTATRSSALKDGPISASIKSLLVHRAFLLAATFPSSNLTTKFRVQYMHLSRTTDFLFWVQPSPVLHSAIKKTRNLSEQSPVRTIHTRSHSRPVAHGTRRNLRSGTGR